MKKYFALWPRSASTTCRLPGGQAVTHDVTQGTKMSLDPFLFLGVGVVQRRPQKHIQVSL
jgi:hypothetical protein